MPISTEREKRVNAGSRMARLLNEEDEDDFYAKTYGGFNEEADDVDYQSESSVDDIIDTDFADSSTTDGENDMDASDEESGAKKRTRRVVTKSYKEPKKAKPVEKKSHDEAKAAKRSEQPKATPDVPAERPKLRQSTVDATRQAEDEFRRRKDESESATVRRKNLLAEIAQRKNVPEVRRLTQAELLAEAKITEEINRRSLARYQKMEIEKKRARVAKVVRHGPMIQYRSVTVPDMDEQHDAHAVKIDSETGKVSSERLILKPEAKCSRVFISFTDDFSFKSAMPRSARLPNAAPKAPKQRVKICPISGLPARYVDPMTGTHYANLAAFRVLRQLYAMHLKNKVPPIELLRRYRLGEIDLPV